MKKIQKILSSIVLSGIFVSNQISATTKKIVRNKVNTKYDKSDDYKILNKEDSKFLKRACLYGLTMGMPVLAVALHLYNKKNSNQIHNDKLGNNMLKPQDFCANPQSCATVCLSSNDIEVLRKIKTCIDNNKWKNVFDNSIGKVDSNVNMKQWYLHTIPDIASDISKFNSKTQEEKFQILSFLRNDDSKRNLDEAIHNIALSRQPQPEPQPESQSQSSPKPNSASNHKINLTENQKRILNRILCLGNYKTFSTLISWFNGTLDYYDKKNFYNNLIEVADNFDQINSIANSNQEEILKFLNIDGLDDMLNIVIEGLNNINRVQPKHNNSNMVQLPIGSIASVYNDIDLSDVENFSGETPYSIKENHNKQKCNYKKFLKLFNGQTLGRLGELNDINNNLLIGDDFFSDVNISDRIANLNVDDVWNEMCTQLEENTEEITWYKNDNNQLWNNSLKNRIDECNSLRSTNCTYNEEKSILQGIPAKLIFDRWFGDLRCGGHVGDPAYLYLSLEDCDTCSHYIFEPGAYYSDSSTFSQLISTHPCQAEEFIKFLYFFDSEAKMLGFTNYGDFTDENLAKHERFKTLYSLLVLAFGSVLHSGSRCVNQLSDTVSKALEDNGRYRFSNCNLSAIDKFSYLYRNSVVEHTVEDICKNEGGCFTSEYKRAVRFVTSHLLNLTPSIEYYSYYGTNVGTIVDSIRNYWTAQRMVKFIKTNIAVFTSQEINEITSNLANRTLKPNDIKLIKAIYGNQLDEELEEFKNWWNENSSDDDNEEKFEFQELLEKLNNYSEISYELLSQLKIKFLISSRKNDVYNTTNELIFDKNENLNQIIETEIQQKSEDNQDKNNYTEILENLSNELNSSDISNKLVKKIKDAVDGHGLIKLDEELNKDNFRDINKKIIENEIQQDIEFTKQKQEQNQNYITRLQNFLKQLADNSKLSYELALQIYNEFQNNHSDQFENLKNVLSVLTLSADNASLLKKLQEFVRSEIEDNSSQSISCDSVDKLINNQEVTVKEITEFYEDVISDISIPDSSKKIHELKNLESLFTALDSENAGDKTQSFALELMLKMQDNKQIEFYAHGN